MRIIAILAALAASGCATQGAFDRLASDVASGFAALQEDAEQARQAQADAESELASVVAGIVEEKELITSDEAAARFAEARATARAEAERIDAERIEKAAREAETMRLHAELRKRESEAETREMIAGLVEAGVGTAMGRPAFASAIRSTVEAAYGGEPATTDQVAAALREGGISSEEALAYSGIVSTLMGGGVMMLRNRSRRELERSASA